MNSIHIDEGSLERYAMGQLAGPTLASFDEHLLECVDCQHRLEQIDQFMSAFRQAVVDLPAPVPFWRRPPRLAWAVPAMAVAAGLIVMVSRPAVQTAVPAVIQMQALRGPESSQRVLAEKPMVFRFAVPEIAPNASYEVEFVNPSGRPVLSKKAQAKDGTISIPVSGLRRGSYWVRVYDGQPNRELLAEYGLQAR
jgi:hypothetical protein